MHNILNVISFECFCINSGKFDDRIFNNNENASRKNTYKFIFWK